MVLAHHLYQAGAEADPAKTLTYLKLAAKLASASAAHEEALNYLDQALSLINEEGDPHAAELHAWRAVALRSLSRSGEATDSYHRAIAMFVEGRRVREAAEASFHLAVMHSWNADMVPALRAVNCALEFLDLEDSALRYRLLLLKAVFESFCDIEAGFTTLAQAKLLEASLPETSADGHARTHEARLYWNAAQLERADHCAKEAITRFRAAGDLWGEANVWEPIPVALCMGRVAAVETLIRDAAAHAERVGHQSAVWLCKNFSAEVYVALGDLQKAERAAH